MSVHQRGTRWRAVVRIKGAPTIARSFSTEAEALQFHQATADAIRSGRVSEVIAADLTVATALRGWLKAESPKHKGYLVEKQRAEFLLADPVAQISAANFSRPVVRALRDRLKRRGCSGSTVNRYLSVLRSAIRRSLREHDAPFDLAAFAEMRLPENAARTTAPTDAEVEAMLAAADPAMRAFLLLACCAMRRGEILKLQWGSTLDLKAKLAHLLDTKNGTSRTVPITDRAVAALEALPRPLHGGPVFGDLTPNLASQRFKALAKRCGVACRLHDVRAFSATKAVQSTDVATAMRLGGWKTTSAFQRYLRQGDIERLRAAVA
jgi:integrase